MVVKNAFNDQCTGANPRYPLMSEIKEIYLKAFHEGYVFRMTLQADVSLRGFSVLFGPVQREREI